MLNKLEALRYFCSAAETLHFSETATRLAVSPQVVTRIIAELEALLGEQLFKRNTRRITLTPFGEALLPKAQKLLAESEALFASTTINENAMTGVVRIALPPLPDRNEILAELFEKLKDYPDLRLDWQVNTQQQNWIEEQIDVGIRVSVNTSPDPNFIIKPICHFHEVIVASPALLAQLGSPKNIEDLIQRFPISNLINVNTGQLWHWGGSESKKLKPKPPHFVSNEAHAEIQAALAGRAVAQVATLLVQPYLDSGRLVQLFPEAPTQTLQLYVYRPHQTVTSTRVKWVFDELAAILRKRYREE
ncbi:LysR family transcriptional regulator [Avibacterium endocarditidis]|uniref:LysR family transcriptional regulator n=1 Tax=Avibacterium TaxID=292486 RepID=UPI0039FBAA1B